MPVPDTPPDLANPIRELAQAGTTAGPEVTRITPPEREYDGRRCHVHFAPGLLAPEAAADGGGGDQDGEEEENEGGTTAGDHDGNLGQRWGQA